VPTLNEVENVDELLRQIFELDAGPFEVVVVDDASTDGTVERVLAWAETRPVRLVQRQGPAASRAP
jgi:glycosyltransferase involved in cell wall biosynthesis